MTSKRQPQPKRTKSWLLTWTEGYNPRTGQRRKRRRHFEFGEDALRWESQLIAQGFKPELLLEGFDGIDLAKLDLTEISNTPLGEMVRRARARQVEGDK